MRLDVLHSLPAKLAGCQSSICMAALNFGKGVGTRLVASYSVRAGIVMSLGFSVLLVLDILNHDSSWCGSIWPLHFHLRATSR